MCHIKSHLQHCVSNIPSVTLSVREPEDSAPSGDLGLQQFNVLAVLLHP